MKTILILISFALGLSASFAWAGYETDTIATAEGNLEITFIGHGSLMFTFAGKVIDVDPFGKLGDYSLLPKADLILITHEHPDHYDPKALSQARTASTMVVANEAAAKKIEGAFFLQNGEEKTFYGIKIEAVPAYNIVHLRDTGEPFHPKGAGNGYILTFDSKRVYVAGDTENIPEMKSLKDIDIAFLPMNLPYTMTPEMVADAAKAFKPKVLYPYHYGQTDPARLVALLQGEAGIEVRIRKMQ